MTSMPVLDKAFTMQNALSQNQAKTVSSSGGSNFESVLKQSSDSGKGTESTVQKASETGKTSETGKASETEKGQKETSQDKVNETGKTEEKTEKMETGEEKPVTETQDVEEKLMEDTELVEKAAGEMVAAIAAQLGISEVTVRETMEDMQISEISLLQPETVKELMIELTEGTDGMSLLTDGNFYASVSEVLETLTEVKGELAEETGLNGKELDTALQGLEKKLGEAVQEVPAEKIPLYQETELRTENTPKIQQPVTAEEQPEIAETVNPAAQEKKNTGHESSEKGSQQFMQSTYQSQTLPSLSQLQQLTEVETTFTMPDTQDIMEQIMDYMKVSVKPEMTDLAMQLHPESLGTLHIQISSREGVMTAQFTTQNEDVRAVLESQMMELKQNLEQQGIKVEAVEVTVAQYSLDRNPEGNESETGQEQQKQKKGSRNLNLNEIGSEEELTAEEKLAAEVMKSEGSTVSYQA